MAPSCLRLKNVRLSRKSSSRQGGGWLAVGIVAVFIVGATLLAARLDYKGWSKMGYLRHTLVFISVSGPKTVRKCAALFGGSRGAGRKERVLIRKSCANGRDANPVIEIDNWGIGNGDLGHVTGNAAAGFDGANICRFHGYVLSFTACVTFQAIAVVSCRLSHNRLMRIVTCRAADALVLRVPAATGLKTIRLGDDTLHALRLLLAHCIRGGVTLSAKIGFFFCAQMSWIEDCRL